jgi:hypothetical protein
LEAEKKKGANGVGAPRQVALPSVRRAARAVPQGEAAGAGSPPGSIAGWASTSISAEGSPVADVVSTMNASGFWEPERNDAVYIRSCGSLGRGIPGRGRSAGRVRMKMSAYAISRRNDWSVGRMARRTCMKSSRLQC